jgi:hypothetical protein
LGHLAIQRDEVNLERRKELKVFEEQENRVIVGQEAEDFPVKDNLSLSDFRGQPILLVFWKTL